ncbi:MAG: glycosyltransferase family 2 protein [Anaerolineaceae bacterium]
MHEKQKELQILIKPLISIVTPSYNQAKYLEQTIQSVLSQDYSSIEYIVVDGGSTDGSTDIIQKYSDRLAWWVTEKDRGQADAVNKGFAKTKGKYCGWVNSDDLYLPGAVAQAVAILEENDDIGFVFGDVKSIDENNKITNIMRYGNWKLTDLMRFNIIGQPGVFFRKDLWERVGGLDLNYHFLLDHHLWIRMASEARIVYSGKIWAAARFHSAAKNIANTSMFGVEAIQLAQWISESPKFRGEWEENKNKIWAGAYRIKGRYLLDGGNAKESLKAYWSGLLLDPKTIWPEMHRFIYAILCLIGLTSFKKLFLKMRFQIKRPDRQRD